MTAHDARLLLDAAASVGLLLILLLSTVA